MSTKAITIPALIAGWAAWPVVHQIKIDQVADQGFPTREWQLAASSPDDTNSITEPTKIAPVTASVEGLAASFTRTFSPYSITVLQLTGK